MSVPNTNFAPSAMTEKNSSSGLELRRSTCEQVCHGQDDGPSVRILVRSLSTASLRRPSPGSTSNDKNLRGLGVSKPPKDARPSSPHRPCCLQKPTEHGVRKVFGVFLANATSTILSTVIAAPKKCETIREAMFAAESSLGLSGLPSPS